ncbi:MAG: DUF3172 domain-containing protein [Prochlorotrichaceae cyanobacterium]
MARRPARNPNPSRSNYPSTAEPRSGLSLNPATLGILGGIFIAGVGVGIAFSSSTNFTPENVVSREAIDRAAPNPELCAQYGASSIAVDVRMFVTLNPFNAYVAQPTMRPGCVLRSNNWSILEQRGLVSNQDVRECKNRMNTFGFVGALEAEPEIECIYQNDAAKNLFLDRGIDGAPPESERF